MYDAKSDRYEKMKYRRAGESGLMLPEISLGIWQNFGGQDSLENAREMLKTAFDAGITHFDAANNYGPPYGSAEETLGIALKKDFSSYRDELVISSKAGFDMWPGPYGNYGSKKYITASIDASLKRMGLDYVDIFYHHRPDPDTPLEETAYALDLLVRQGKALYVGVSNYQSDQTYRISKIFKELKTPFIIHQPRYNLFDRWMEDGLTDVLKSEGLGAIAFSPLCQGILTERYLKGVPKDSRANKNGTLKKETVDIYKEKVEALAAVASGREQTLSQMALSWVLSHKFITSVLIGASSPEQIKENVKAIENTEFTNGEIDAIDRIVKV